MVILYTLLTCRAGILCFVLILNYETMLTDTELPSLFYLLLPVTAMYFVFVVKCVINKRRYIIAGKKVEWLYFCIPVGIFILLHVFEMVLIYYKNVFYSPTDIEPLCKAIAVMECALAGYAGYRLSGLFADKTGEEASVS